MDERARSQRWLFGPVPDLLLGCGVGYALLIATFVAFQTEYASVVGIGVIPLISIFTGTPHYGATLLRVYENPADRRAYVFFAVWVTAAVWALFYAGLYSPLLGSLLFTIYLSWSPWHYTGQNYGIAVMFLRRRGVSFTPLAKRALYVSFMISYLLTVIALHGAQRRGEYAPVEAYQEGAYHLLALGIPSPLWELLFYGLLGAYLVSLVAAGALLLRHGSVRDLLPTAALAATQMVWFSLPVAAREFGLLGSDAVLASNRAAYAFFWIATGHSVQYLWITTYYAAGRSSGGVRARYLGKTLLAGSFIWSVPALVYGLSVEGSRLGGIARGQDVFVLLASMVNIHHFILDGAIWKLRDGRVARVLIRRDAEPERPEPVGPRRRRWLAPAVYALGLLATLQVLVSWGERQFRFEPAFQRGDVYRAERSIERMANFRNDGEKDYMRLGELALVQQDWRTAERAFRTSLEKRPSPSAHLGLGRVAQAQGDHQRAIAAYRAALGLNPDHVQALNLLGLTWLQVGRPDLAIEPLERAVELMPEHETLGAALERARQRAPGAEQGLETGATPPLDVSLRPASPSPPR